MMSEDGIRSSFQKVWDVLAKKQNGQAKVNIGEDRFIIRDRSGYKMGLGDDVRRFNSPLDLNDQVSYSKGLGEFREAVNYLQDKFFTDLEAYLPVMLAKDERNVPLGESFYKGQVVEQDPFSQETKNMMAKSNNIYNPDVLDSDQGTSDEISYANFVKGIPKELIRDEPAFPTEPEQTAPKPELKPVSDKVLQDQLKLLGITPTSKPDQPTPEAKAEVLTEEKCIEFLKDKGFKIQRKIKKHLVVYFGEDGAPIFSEKKYKTLEDFNKDTGLTGSVLVPDKYDEEYEEV